MQRSLTSKETFNSKEMMNKKFIKLFMFSLFKEQASSCTKTSAKQTFQCEEYLQCDKKNY